MGAVAGCPDGNQKVTYTGINTLHFHNQRGRIVIEYSSFAMRSASLHRYPFIPRRTATPHVSCLFQSQSSAAGAVGGTVGTAAHPAITESTSAALTRKWLHGNGVEVWCILLIFTVAPVTARANTATA